MVSRTSTARFDGRVHFLGCVFNRQLKKVDISQDMLFPGLNQRSRLPVSLQQNLHDRNFHCVS